MKNTALICGLMISVSFGASALDVKQRFDHLDKDKDGFLMITSAGIKTETTVYPYLNLNTI